jgi:hypothetical protein
MILRHCQFEFGKQLGRGLRTHGGGVFRQLRLQRVRRCARGEFWKLWGELTEDGSGCVVTGETGLAHTRTVANVLAATVLELRVCAPWSWRQL